MLKSLTKFKLHRLFGQKTYFYFIVFFVICLPLSPYFLSVSQFLLGLNWIAEGGFKNKWKTIKQNKALWLFLLLPLVHILWLINTTDFAYALHDLKIKVPLLILPLIIGTSQPLSSKQLKIVLNFFVAAVMAASFICTAIYLGAGNYDITDVRQISVFVSHIRFSLMVVFSLVVLLFYLCLDITKLANLYLWIYIGSMLWLLFFLVILQSMTGWVVLIFLTYFLSIYYFKHFKKRWLKNTVILFLVLIPVFIIALFGKVMYDFYPKKPLDVAQLPVYSASGNKYIHKPSSWQVENGHYVYTFLVKEELKSAWNRRSRIKLSEQDKKGQQIYFTLLRYLTSKGLTKDKEGVMTLTNQDVERIEMGYASCVYNKRFIPYIKAYELLWEFDRYLKTGDANNKSVVMRFEYVKTGLSIAKNHFLFGVGTGDLKREYKRAYVNLDSKLDIKNQKRAHNQYLTFFISFGLVGFGLAMVALFGPAFYCKHKRNMLLLGFLFVMFASMLNEDTLENQAGVTLFIAFYSILIFSDKPKKEHG